MGFHKNRYFIIITGLLIIICFVLALHVTDTKIANGEREYILPPPFSPPERGRREKGRKSTQSHSSFKVQVYRKNLRARLFRTIFFSFFLFSFFGGHWGRAPLSNLSQSLAPSLPVPAGQLLTDRSWRFRRRGIFPLSDTRLVLLEKRNSFESSLTANITSVFGTRGVGEVSHRGPLNYAESVKLSEKGGCESDEL